MFLLKYDNDMNNNRLYLALSIVTLVALQYLLMSVAFNDIAYIIVGDNPFLSLFGAFNNVILSLFPIFVFFFLVCSTNFMLDLFEIRNISSKEIMVLIGLSMIPLLIGMIFYNVSVLFFMQENPHKIEDVENLHFLFNLQIEDFGLINKLCWFIMYYLIFAILYFKYQLSIIQALLTTLVPTLLFLVFCYMIKSFGSNQWHVQNI